MTEAKKLYQNRRSVYALGKNLPISEQEVIDFVEQERSFFDQVRLILNQRMQ